MTSVVTVPEGESGLSKKSLTGERLESLVAWFSLPSKLRGEWQLPGDEKALAKSLGVGVRDLDRWKRQPKVYEAVAQTTRLQAIYLMPEILEKQGELALEKRDTKAARYVAQIAGVLSEGTKIEVNTANTVNIAGDPSHMPDGALFERAASIWAKVKEAAVPVEAEVVEDPE